jgi:molybdate transport system substrate-binding protein
MRRSQGVRLACIAWLGVIAPFTGAASQEKPVMVFAAASLKTAFDKVNQSFERETGKAATIVYAASNVLAKQIEAGAPADLFVSADVDWMDYAQSRDLIRPDSRVNLLGNTLVLIAPKNSDITIAPNSRLDLSMRLGAERLATGNVEAVPAGRYAKATLERLGEWAGVKDRIAQAENVRAALLLVSRGEAPLGVVYRTDALSDAKVKIVFTFPADSHPPIVYPAALTAGANGAGAVSFLAFLSSVSARRVFEARGFVILNQQVPPS